MSIFGFSDDDNFIKVKTGHYVEHSGIYRCSNNDCNEEMTFVKKDKVPPCPHCNNTYFIEIKLAKHYSEF